MYRWKSVEIFWGFWGLVFCDCQWDVHVHRSGGQVTDPRTGSLENKVFVATHRTVERGVPSQCSAVVWCERDNGLNKVNLHESLDEIC